MKLRGLESLLRRVKELGLQPLSNCRREIVAWTLSDLAHHYPELSDFQAWCIEHRYKELSEIVDHHAACNRQEQIDKWARSMDDNTESQRKWVRRAVQEDELRDTPSLDATCNLDPTNKVEEVKDE